MNYGPVTSAAGNRYPVQGGQRTSWHVSSGTMSSRYSTKSNSRGSNNRGNPRRSLLTSTVEGSDTNAYTNTNTNTNSNSFANATKSKSDFVKDLESVSSTSNQRDIKSISRNLRLSYQDYTQMQFDFSRIQNSLMERIHEFQELLVLAEGTEFEFKLNHIHELLIRYGYNMKINHPLSKYYHIRKKSISANSDSYKSTVESSVFDKWDLMKTVIV